MSRRMLRAVILSFLLFVSLTPLATHAEDGWAEVGIGSASAGGISQAERYARRVSMAVSPSGDVYAAWMGAQPFEHAEIFVKRWNGIAWAEVGEGSATGGGISNSVESSESPSIAVAPDGTPYIAWRDDAGGSAQIYVRRWNGAVWEEVGAGSASGLGISRNTLGGYKPSLAVAPDGTPYVAWEGSDSGNLQIYVRRWNGASWEEIGGSSATGGGISMNYARSEDANLAVGIDGTVYVVWNDYNGPSMKSEIYAKQWSGSVWRQMDNYSAFEGGISRTADTSWLPSIATAPDGSLYVAWADKTGGSWEIYVLRWNGATWEEVGPASASGGGISNNGTESLGPAVAVASDGTPYVSWFNDVGGTDQIYVRRWSGAEWEETEPGSASAGGISNTSGTSEFPYFASDPAGPVYLGWSDRGSGIYQIYVRARDVQQNSAPALTCSSSNVEAQEGQVVWVDGTVVDHDGDDVTLAASIGDVTSPGDGTWSWALTTSDGPDDSQDVTVTAEDGSGGVSTVTFTLSVDNVAPTADAGGPYTGTVGVPLTLTGTASDPGADTLTYEWDLDDDGVYDDGVGETVSNTWTVAGSYGAAMRVTDDDGATSASTASVTIEAAAGPITSGLIYSTFVGGSDTDYAGKSAVDSEGALYIVGDTWSSDLIPDGVPAYDSDYSGNGDAFVVKLAPDGETVVYATYLGGSQRDRPRGVAVDEEGCAYVVGMTASSDFVAAQGPGYDTTYGGGSEDAFVVKLSADGTSLGYATFVGGSSGDMGRRIAVDDSGAAYITGETYSPDFPANVGPGYDSTLDGMFDAFVVKLSPSGLLVEYASFFGGDGWDYGDGIAVTDDGYVYVCGYTKSSDFPAAYGSGYDTTYNGGGSIYGDAFVLRLSENDTSLVDATFLGGSGEDYAHHLVVDDDGGVYVVGSTNSSEFPATYVSGYDSDYNGGWDGFIVKLSSDLTGLKYASYLGGAENDWAYGIAANPIGQAYVYGRTFSSNCLPTVGPGYDLDYSGGGDAYLAVLSEDGSSIIYGSYIGGSGDDRGSSVSLDQEGLVYATGSTSSSDFPVGPGYDLSLNGGTFDGYTFKLATGISQANTRPEISVSENPVLCVVGVAARAGGTVADEDGDSVTLAASTGNVIDNGDGTWSWTWTSEPVAGGAMTVTITADDGQDTSSCEFLVVVSGDECVDLEAAAMDHRSYLFRPGLATDGTTLWVVSESGNPARALFSMSHDAGSTWSTPLYVSGDLTWARDPGIYMDPSGMLWAYWRMRDLGGIWYARSEDYGYSWSEPDVLVDDGYDDWAPEMIEYEGVLYLFTHLAQFSSSGRLGYRASTDGGVTWSARQSLPIAWSSRARNTTPMIDDQNRLWLIWLDEDGERDVYVTHSTGDMQSWLTPVQVSLVSEFDSAPSMEQDGNGVFWAFWPSAPSASVASVHNQLYYATSVDDCETWSTPQPYVVSDQSDGSPRAFVLDNGAVGSIWERHYNSSWTDTSIMVRTDCSAAEPVSLGCQASQVFVTQGDVAVSGGTYAGHDVVLTSNVGQVSVAQDGTWSWLLQTDCMTRDQIVEMVATDGMGVTASCTFKLVAIDANCHGAEIPAIDHGAYLFRPDLETDGEQTLWAVTESGSPARILLTMSQDKGQTWSSPYTVSGDQVWARDPSVSLDSSGRLWVVWRMRDLGELWYALSQDGGQTWSQPAVLISDGLDDWSPKLVDYNGNLYVFSHQNQFSASGRQGYRVSQDDGATWSEYTQIPGTWSEHAWYGSPYVDRLGRLWLIWTTTDQYPVGDVYVSYTTGDLGDWADPVQLSAFPENDGMPSITQSEDGTYYAFWPSAAGGDSDIYYNISADGGETWSSPLLCVDTPLLDSAPCAISLSDGTVGFLWDKENSGWSDLSLLYTTLNRGVTAPRVTSDAGHVAVDEGAMAIAIGSYVDSDCGPTTLSASVGELVDAGDGTWSWRYSTSDGPGDSQVVVISAVDGFGGEDSVAFDLEVSNVSPSVDVGPDETLQPPLIGQFSRTGITFADPGADAWTGTVDWDDGVTMTLSIDQTTKSFDLDHIYDSEGHYTVTVTVADDDGGVGASSCQVTVHLNTPPVADAGGPYEVNEGASLQLDGSGTTDAQQEPATLTYEWDLDGDGEYDDATGVTPTFDAAALDGASTVTVGLQVTDSYGEADSGTAEMIVLNVSPTAVDDTAQVGEDGPAIAIAVLDNDSDPAGTKDPLSVLLVETAETTGTVTLVDGVVTYDPAGAFEHLPMGQASLDEFSYTIDDGDGGQDSAMVLVTVEGVNDAPTVSVDAAEVAVDEGQLAANSGAYDDVDYGSALSLSACMGDVVDNGDGTWSWSALGEDGPWSGPITVQVEDEHEAVASVVFTLTVDNAAPTAVDDTAQVGEDGPAISVAVLDNDSDPAGANDPLSVVLVETAETTGTVMLVDGLVTYDPADAFEHLSLGSAAQDQFSYTIDDGDGGQGSATVLVAVVGANDVPTVSVDSTEVAVDEGQQATNTGMLADVDENAVLGLSASMGNVVDNGDGTWSWSALGEDGPWSGPVTIDVRDEHEGVASVDFTLTVNNVSPSAVDDIAQVGEDGASIEVAVLDNDSDPAGAHDVLSVTEVETASTLGEVTLVAGVVTYDPAGAFEHLAMDAAALDEFGYTIDDGDGGQDGATVLVTVVGVNDAPTVSVDPTEVAVAEGQQATNSGTFADVDDDAVLSLSASMGEVVDNGDGTWNWSALGEDGPWSGPVTVSVQDEHEASATVAFTLTVRNVPPTAADDTAQVGEDGPAIEVVVLDNDSDPAGANDPLNVASLETVNTTGTVTLVDGVVRYDPAGAFEHLALGDAAVDQFGYTIADGDGGQDDAMVLVTVVGENDAPTLTVDEALVAVAEGDFAANAGTWADVDDGAVVALSASAGDVVANGDGSWNWSWETDDGPSESQTVTITADDGMDSTTVEFELVVSNVAPVAALVADPPEINEGDVAQLRVSDPYDPSDADTAAGFIYSYDCDGDGAWDEENLVTDVYGCLYMQDGKYWPEARIQDKDGDGSEYAVMVTVNNVCPEVGPIQAPIDPLELGSEVTASAVFTDPGVLDVHAATWDWGDGTVADGIVTEDAGSGAVVGSHTYAEPGVYRIILTVADEACSVATEFDFVVIYDPEGGFVTGGGWIMSPEGAYTGAPTLTGKATFGFVSKYKKGATVPTGQTQFQFKTGDLNFHSDAYEWLVVAGAKAKYKGEGTINGEGNYGFMISAIDAKLTPSTDVALFRIKIWDRDAGDAPVYDNQLGAEEDADPTTALGGGSIVVHTEK